MKNPRSFFAKRLYILSLLMCIATANLLNAQCIIDDLVLETSACNDLNEFTVALDFNWGGGADSFYVQGNGNNYGTFAKADLPVTLSSPFFIGDGTTIYEFVILDSELEEDCSTFAVLEPISCGPMGCDIWNVNAVASDCDNNELFAIVVDFSHNDQDGEFIIVGNGMTYGPSPYSDLPFTIGDFEGSDAPYEFIIYDTDSPDCTADFTVTQDCSVGGDCNITELDVQAVDCDPNDPDGLFTFLINLEVENAGNDFVDVFVDGEFIDFFPINDIPIQFPYSGSNGMVQVCVNDNNLDCCATAPYENPCVINNCEIWDIVATPSDCNDLGGFDLTINFNYANTSSTFNIVENGISYGTFSYSDLPITLTDLEANGSVYEFIINDSDQPDCGAAIGLDSENCLGVCQINDFIIEATDCDATGSYYVVIDFNVLNPESDSFNLLISNASTTILQTYAYSDLPITLGPIVGDGETYMFSVWDIEDNNCSAGATIESEDCIGGDCAITELDIEAVDCDPATGQFVLLIDFVVENAVSDEFDVFANGNLEGTFPLSILPLEIPYDGNGSAVTVQVCSHTNPDCCDFVTVVDPCSSDCEIWDAEAFLGPCNDLGLFDVSINFNYANTSNTFTLVGNGMNYGTFNYSDLPIDITGLEGDGSVYELIITDSDQSDCGAEIILESEECPAICQINDFIVEAYDCDADGNFLVDINFNVVNPESDSFNLLISNPSTTILMTFAYADLWITVGPFVGNGSTYMFSVWDMENESCSAQGSIISENCIGGGDCDITELDLQTVDCDSDGNFIFIIDFEVENPGNDFFDFYVNDALVETSPLSSLPTELLYNGNGIDGTVQVCINDNPDCCLSMEYIDPCNNNNCEIWDAEIDVTDCNDLALFDIAINFNYANTSSTFSLVGNGNNYGTFSYNDLPITLTDFEANGSTYEFIVSDSDQPDCGGIFSIDSENCTGDCQINDFVLEASDCDADGNFYIDIDFNVENPVSDSFNLLISNPFTTILMTFAYSDLVVTIGPFVGDGTTYSFSVWDIENESCSAEGILELEDCIGGGDCAITSDLELGTIDCDPNGNFIFIIDFEVENPSSNFFDVFVNGNLEGTFLISSLPVELPYNGNGEDGIVQVCINDNPDCCASMLYDYPCNTSNCEIWDIDFEPTDCNGLGFDVLINFNYANTSDWFTVVGNGINYGPFAYSELPITIADLEANGSTYEFIISDDDEPDCGGVISFDSEDCSDPTDCEINQLDVYPLSCNPDGSYSVLIIFDYENVTADVFDVYAASQFIGTYNYNELPLTISSFPASGNDIDVLTVCDNDSDLCCEVAEFEALDCESCEIVAVLLEEEACDNDDNFMINLDLNVQGAGPIGFMVLGNGTNYGTFAYSDLPIQLGPFPGDGITEYEFIVVDLANTDCVGSAAIGPIDCQVPPQVWPGDANLDYISNHFDLLSLGIAYGETGEARTSSNIDWMSFEGADWSGAFANGINWKHADCNGDGVINNLDITAIDANYNEVHGDPLPYIPIDLVPGSPELTIDLPEFADITLGEAFVAPISLGTIDTPIDEIYAIAFTVEYDPTMMDEAGVYVETGSSWLGEQGSQLISIDKSFASEGIIEVAITRTDQTDIAGYGTISYFIGVIDDIAGKTELSVEITNVVAITHDEARISLGTPTAVIDLTTDVENLIDGTVSIFPNPAQTTLNISTTGTEMPERVIIYNTLGQLIKRIETPSNRHYIDLSNWQSGIYFVEMQFSKGSINRKVEVIK